MVHRKYIKRNGRIFGPYLYENYRENGITKTRYLGKDNKKMRVNFKFIFAIVVILILVSLIVYSNLVYEGDKEVEDEGLFSISNLFDFFDFFRVSVGVSVNVTSFCGNGILEVGEECDDGNNVGGDGCSSFCTVEGNGGGNGGGGGGGGGTSKEEVNKTCIESWICMDDWSDCRNLVRVFEINKISAELKNSVEEACAGLNWGSEFCGVQERECYDQNSCNTSVSKPDIVRECYYAEEEPAIVEPFVKPDRFLVCLIFLILISLLILLTEHFLRRYFLLKNSGRSFDKKDRKLKECVIFSLLLAIAVILFLIFYCWVCTKFYLLVPALVFVLMIFIRYIFTRHQERV